MDHPHDTAAVDKSACWQTAHRERLQRPVLPTKLSEILSTQDIEELTMARAEITVEKYMKRNCVLLKPDMDILEASQILVNKQLSGAAVMDGTKLAGILTERDCFKITLHAGYFSEYGGKVSEFMSTELETVSPEMSILDIADRFMEKTYRRYPVLDKGQFVGMIDRRDVLKALLDLG